MEEKKICRDCKKEEAMKFHHSGLCRECWDDWYENHAESKYEAEYEPGEPYDEEVEE